MKYGVRLLKSMAIALAELAPYVLDPEQIQTGRPFKNFDNGRPRELLANWVICATLNAEAGF